MKKKQTKQKKMTKQQFEDARKALYASYGGVKRRKFKDLSLPDYEWKDRSSDSYKSLEGTGQANCGRTNMMEPTVLQKESPEIQKEIKNKASRLIPLYNKGPIQLATDVYNLSDGNKKR